MFHLVPQEGRLAAVTKRGMRCGGRGSVGVRGVAGRIDLRERMHLARETTALFASHPLRFWLWCDPVVAGAYGIGAAMAYRSLQ